MYAIHSSYLTPWSFHTLHNENSTPVIATTWQFGNKRIAKSARSVNHFEDNTRPVAMPSRTIIISFFGLLSAIRSYTLGVAKDFNANLLIFFGIYTLSIFLLSIFCIRLGYFWISRHQDKSANACPFFILYRIHAYNMVCTQNACEYSLERDLIYSAVNVIWLWGIYLGERKNEVVFLLLFLIRRKLLGRSRIWR